MRRAALGTCVAGLAALAASSLPTTATAAVPTGATGATAVTTPTSRLAVLEEARATRAAVARSLHLGLLEALVVKDAVVDADGTEHVRYDRTYAGLPVLGGDLVVHTPAGGRGETVDLAGSGEVAVPSLTPLVDATDAGTAALGAGRLPLLGSVLGTTRKVVWAYGRTPVLAWETRVSGEEDDGTPVEDLVYTDARTGTRLGVLPQVRGADATGKSLYSGTVGLKAVLSSGTYYLTDNLRGGHKTYDAKGSTNDLGTGSLMQDADGVWGNGTTSSRQSVGADAAYGAAEAWDYFKETFSRVGVAGDGVALYSRVHYGTGYGNAFYYAGCGCVAYGDGNATYKAPVSLDIAGHETTHGVTASTAGLVYSGESGGLDEATSDVFGTMIEFAAANANDPGDYRIGEKIVASGAVRRMDQPTTDGSSVGCWSSSVAGLDPHYSSGIGNRAFYLLAEGTGTKTIGGLSHKGTTCNGSTVTGIGRAPAAAIWYRALTTYWTSGTTYAQAANGMVRAARDLYGASSTRCAATVAAWKGVSVVPTETCAAVTPPSGSNVVVNPGFEQGTTGWSASSGVVTNDTTTPPHAGSWYAWFGGYGVTHADSLAQPVAVPAGTSATLSFWMDVATAETDGTPHDTLTVQVVDGTTTTTLATYSDLDVTDGYELETLDLSAYAGRTVQLRFAGSEDAAAATSFLVDDVSVTAP